MVLYFIFDNATKNEFQNVNISKKHRASEISISKLKKVELNPLTDHTPTVEEGKFISSMFIIHVSFDNLINNSSVVITVANSSCKVANVTLCIVSGSK